MMCAVVLRPERGEKHGRIYRASEATFEAMLRGYRRTLSIALRHPRLLRRISWQGAAAHLAQFLDLDWLTVGLEAKYGIKANDA